MATVSRCSEPPKKRPRHGFRYQMEFKFESEDAKHAFLARRDNAKRLLAPRGDNRELLSCLLDKLGETSVDASNTGNTSKVPPQPMLERSGLSIIQNLSHRVRRYSITLFVIIMIDDAAGIFTTDDYCAEDQKLFVCEFSTLYDLCKGLTQPCVCQATSWTPVRSKNIQVVY